MQDADFEIIARLVKLSNLIAEDFKNNASDFIHFDYNLLEMVYQINYAITKNCYKLVPYQIDIQNI